MLGAASLCAKAALRSGAGLVTVGIPTGMNKILQRKLPDEVMTKPLPETAENTLSEKAFSQINKFLKKIDVLAVGPGLSQNKSTQRLIRKIVSRVNIPMVIDADGLNALVGHLNLLIGKKIVTPHPGEMSRLLKMTTSVIQKQRKDIAKAFARKYNCIVVLKGARTVVADKDGQLYVNQTGNPGMATAGSGDVLTGMIAAFLGQGLNPFLSAKTAVYLHGLAGDLAAQKNTQLGLIASDIIEKIPEAIKKAS